MSINSKLRKEGIKVVEKLNTQEVNKIAIDVASRLCLAFPEHNFSKSDLFESISRISMYVAQMPFDSSGAKYVFRNNSIYFNEDFSLEEMSKLAVHECIHFIQHLYNANSSNLGLYNISNNSGISLNEAAVQLMASEANISTPSSETYFGISIHTISPDYYPLECTLAREITYFTGTYPLYHSALYGDDIFKNTFTLKTGAKAYNTIVKYFDLLLSLESDLNYYVYELQHSNNTKTIKNLTNIINQHKEKITNVFFKAQDLIIEKCFKSDFNSIRNLEDITSFTKKIYNFKNIIGYCDNYSFYNTFYIQMMNLVQEKKASIEKYGEINLFENVNKSLMIIDKSKNLLYYINKFTTKVKKLIHLNKNTKEETNL